MPARMLLLWSQTDQRRFIEAVEKLERVVGDLATLFIAERERRSEAARRANATRRAKGGTLPSGEEYPSAELATTEGQQ